VYCSRKLIAHTGWEPRAGDRVVVEFRRGDRGHYATYVRLADEGDA
jgi:hypothetical protein